MADTLRVLYVDDEPGLLEIGKLFLETGGAFAVDTLTSAGEALMRLDTVRYDAIISDYQMPGMDGIAFLIEVRARFRQVPFILFTGKGREEVVIQAINSGVDFYIQKGGDPKSQFAELANKIRYAISRRRSEEALVTTHNELIASFEHLAVAEEELKAQVVQLTESERSTRLSEERLIMAQEIGRTGSWEYTVATDKIWGSAEGLRIFGFPPFAGDFPIKDIEACIPERDRVHQALVDLVRVGKKYNLEYTINPADGAAPRVIHSIARLEKDAKGNPVRVVGVIHDITERRLVDEEIAFKNVILSTQQETSPNAILLVDENGKILNYNQKFIDTWGIPRDLIASREDGPVLQFILEQLASPEAFLSRVRYLYDHKAEKSFEELLLKDGRVLERFSAPMLGDLGRYYGRVWYFRDITRRVKDEEVLRKIKDYNETLVQASPAFFVAINPGGKTMMMNEAMLQALGYTLDEVVGKDYLATFVPESGRQELSEVLEVLKQAKKPTINENFLLARDGRQLLVEWHGRCIFKENDELDFFFGVGIDITERKKAEQALLKNTEELHAANEELTASQEELRANLDELTRQEHTLQESEDRFRGIFNTITSGVAIYEVRNDGFSGKDYIIKDFNRTALLIEGKKKEDVIGKSLFDLRPAIDEYGLIPVFQQVWKSGVPGYFPQKVYIDDKYSSWYENRVFRLQSGEIVAVYDDITERKQAEIALRESEAKYRGIFDESIAAVYVFDNRKNFINTNQAGLDLLGYSREELLHLRIQDVDADPVVVLPAHGELLSGGRLINYEHRLRRKDGSVITVLNNSSPLTDLHGNVVGIISTLADITGRKQVEEALLDSEETFRVHIENSFDVIFTLDNKGEFVFASPAWERHFGYPVSNVIGKSFAPFVHPDDIAPLSEYLDKVLVSGQSGTSPAYRVRHSDGRWLWFVANGTPYVNPKGERQFIGVGRDITERRRAEESLRESKALIDAVVENVPLMIFLKEATDLRFVVFNRAGEELLGYDRKALLGKNNLDLFPPEQATHFMTKDREVLDGETGVLDIPEESILTAKKGLRLLHTRKVCIRGSDGTTKFLLGISEDITDRKQLETEMKYHEQELMQFGTSLAAANRKLTLLSGITRHDINNQLTVLMGYLAILQKKQTDPTLINFFGKITTAAERISAMIRFTREYEEIGVHAPVWQDCRKLVGTAAIQAPLGKVTVNNDIPAGTEVFADQLITRVFYNLMDNAVRYGGKITTIRFTVKDQDLVHIIVCEDDGVGVPADEKEKIFERGFGKNTGLGLALSREILDITGITLKETGGPGKGARFEIVVPEGAWRIPGKGD